MTAVYPLFLGVDSNGDFVWELPTGRWTWGDDPYQVVMRQRTFTPDRYLEKYGPVEPLVTIESHPGKPPVFKVAGKGTPMTGPAPEPVRDDTPVTNQKTGAVNALAAVARAAQGWAEGSHENEVALGRRDVKPVPEQEFALADILNMINDAAREVGVAPTYGTVE